MKINLIKILKIYMQKVINKKIQTNPKIETKSIKSIKLYNRNKNNN